ncbi:MAG: NERD domain-containing protein [Bacteroides sp.]|nr:NERD domain-containing protein [Bacteroides sp.]MCM1084739.1 NERD domain-containing protein [Bacteroides sp.]
MALILVLILVISLVVVHTFKCRTLVWSKGKVGERRVAAILRQLPKEDYFVFNDLIVKFRNGRSSQIDHVVVSRFAIFVIETKNYKGWIFGHENSEYWTQNIYGHKYRFYNPVKQNAGHIRALREVFDSSKPLPFISIVAFSPQASFKVTAPSVNVVDWFGILPLIRLHSQEKITPDIVERFKERLNSLPIVEGGHREYTKAVRSHIEKRKEMINSGVCPKCGGNLVLRQGKYGSFFGCSNYPKCRFTL